MVNSGWMGDVMSPSPENPIEKGVHGMAVDPKGGEDWLKHPVASTGADVIPFPEIVTPSTRTERPTRLTKEDRERIAREVQIQDRKALITRAVLVLSTLAVTGLAVKHDLNNTGKWLGNEQYVGFRIMEDVSSIPQEGWNMAAPAVEDIARLLGKKEAIPSVFDDRADKQVVKAGVNAVPATPEQIQSIVNEPLPTLEKTTTSTNIFMIFPKRLDKGDINYISNLYRNFKPSPEIPDLIGKSIPFNKGEEIPIPIIKGVKQVEVFQNKLDINGKSTFLGLLLLYHGSDQNSYTLNIGVSYSNAFTLLDAVKDAPIADPRIELVKQKGLSLSLDKPIPAARVNFDVPVSFSTGAFSDSSSKFIYGTINFITNGTGQLLYSPK